MMTREDQLLTILIEECSEVIKACTKAMRFGLDDTWKPDSGLPKWSLTPRQEIQHELNDVTAIVMMLRSNRTLPAYKNDLDAFEVVAKIRKVKAMLKYSQSAGRME